MSVQILVRDQNLNILGVLEGWTSLTATLNFNAVGVWSLSIAAFPQVAALLQSGTGVVIIRDGVVFLSGPMDEPVFTRDGESNGAPGTLTITGSDDLAYVAERLIYPDPTLGIPQQLADSYYTQTSTAGVVIQSLINGNVSMLAPIVKRRATGLMFGSGATLGSTVSTEARFTALTDELRNLAIAGGNLGFRCAQTSIGTGLQQELRFDVYQPRDLSLIARFSFGLGNLRSVTYSDSAPTVTADIVAGGAVAGQTQTLYEYEDPVAEATWNRRVEVYDDQRSTTDVPTLAQYGATALAAGAEQVQITAVTVESKTLRVGADDEVNGITGVGLGDSVSISPLPGVGVVDTVRQLTLTADGTNGELMTIVVGDGSTSTDPTYVAQIRALNKRLSSVERNS